MSLGAAFFVSAFYAASAGRSRPSLTKTNAYNNIIAPGTKIAAVFQVVASTRNRALHRGASIGLMGEKKLNRHQSRVFCALLALWLSGAAHAVTLQGTFSGTVTSSNDLTNTFGLGFGNVLMVRDATQNPASSISDSFSIRSRDTCNGCSFNGPNGLNIIWTEQFTLDISEFLDDSMIVGDGATQTFIWTDDPASPDVATGTFSVNHQVHGFDSSDAFSLLLNEQYGLSFSVYYVEATMTVIPVPGAVWLFASGIAGLFGLARRR